MEEAGAVEAGFAGRRTSLHRLRRSRMFVAGWSGKGASVARLERCGWLALIGCSSGGSLPGVTLHTCIETPKSMRLSVLGRRTARVVGVSRGLSMPVDVDVRSRPCPFEFRCSKNNIRVVHGAGFEIARCDCSRVVVTSGCGPYAWPNADAACEPSASP